MHTYTYICIYYITEIHHSGAYGYSLFLSLLFFLYCLLLCDYITIYLDVVLSVGIGNFPWLPTPMNNSEFFFFLLRFQISHQLFKLGLIIFTLAMRPLKLKEH